VGALVVRDLALEHGLQARPRTIVVLEVKKLLGLLKGGVHALAHTDHGFLGQHWISGHECKQQQRMRKA
jgi:hypothetical protein